MKKLYLHQTIFLAQNPDKSCLVWSCGTSKSRTALEWTKLYPGRSLAIVPKPLLANWKREMEKWGIQIDVITKEEFRRDHKTLPVYKQIICDEIHSGFLTPNFKSQMSKSLKWYLDKYKVKRFLGASATVYCSSAWNIFQLALLLGHNWSWQKWDNKFFTRIRMGNRIIPVQKKGCEPILAEITKGIASVVNIYDVLDVPLQNHCEPEYFSLSKGQEQAIKDNYDPVPIVRYTQQHEIENGILLANEFRKQKTYDYDKEERIEEICKENKKVAIVCRYNAQIDGLASYLKGIDRSLFIIRGDIKERDRVTRAAEEAVQAIVLIQADCAEGYELPSFPLCVFASMSYSYTKWEQICGRFLRMNKPSRTTFLYLLTEGDSVDQGVYDAVKRKEDFKINLFKK